MHVQWLQPHVSAYPLESPHRLQRTVPQSRGPWGVRSGTLPQLQDRSGTAVRRHTGLVGDASPTFPRRLIRPSHHIPKHDATTAGDDRHSFGPIDFVPSIRSPCRTLSRHSHHAYLSSLAYARLPPRGRQAVTLRLLRDQRLVMMPCSQGICFTWPVSSPSRVLPHAAHARLRQELHHLTAQNEDCEDLPITGFSGA